MAESKAESDRSMTELKETIERTSQEANHCDKLTTCQGGFFEEFVEPAIIRLFQGRGFDMTQTWCSAKVNRQGLVMEINLVVMNSTELVAIQYEYQLLKNDVNEFLEKLKLFKQAFPQYQNFDVYGAVAGIEIDEGIDTSTALSTSRYAYKKGLFVIKPSGDTVEIVNDPQFQGRTW